MKIKIKEEVIIVISAIVLVGLFQNCGQKIKGLDFERLSSMRSSAPQITFSSPDKVIAHYAEAATLQVDATGGSLSYEWFKNDVLIPNANLNSLTVLGDPNFKQSGTYKVVISNSLGSIEKEFELVATVYKNSGTGYQVQLGSYQVDLNNIDSGTFTILDKYYAKDQNNCYKLNQVISGCDPGTFEILNSSYGRDVNGIYSLNGIQQNGDQVTIQEDTKTEMDPATFVFINSTFSKDGSFCYQNGTPIQFCDPATFQGIEGSITFAKDANYVFYRGTVVTGADPNTVAVIPLFSSYIVDANRGYLMQYPINADVETFMPIDHHFSKDKNSVFVDIKASCDSNQVAPTVAAASATPPQDLSIDRSVGGGQGQGGAPPPTTSPGPGASPTPVPTPPTFAPLDTIPDADPASFQLLKSGYAKDVNDVFRYNCKLPDADPNTFQFIGDSTQFARDSERVYYNASLVPDADPATFGPLGLWYWKDINRFYYVGEALTNVDAGSAQIFMFDGKPTGYYKDSQRVYYRKVILSTADPATFTLITKDIARDIDNLFAFGKEYVGVDLATFQVLRYQSKDTYYSRDKDRIYCGCCGLARLLDVDPATFQVTGYSSAQDAQGTFNGCSRN